jgi:hypothetical protein
MIPDQLLWPGLFFLLFFASIYFFLEQLDPENLKTTESRIYVSLIGGLIVGLIIYFMYFHDVPEELLKEDFVKAAAKFGNVEAIAGIQAAADAL